MRTLAQKKMLSRRTGPKRGSRHAIMEWFAVGFVALVILYCFAMVFVEAVEGLQQP